MTARQHMDCFTSPNNCWLGDLNCPQRPASKPLNLDWIWDERVRTALREATEQEGWFDNDFLTRVLARLDGQGFHITTKPKPDLTCECCGQERETLPFHSDRYGVTYCQECYDTGCSIGADGGGCSL